MCSFDHWSLRVAQQIIDGIISHELIESDDALGLFAHRALKQVSG